MKAQAYAVAIFGTALAMVVATTAPAVAATSTGTAHPSVSLAQVMASKNTVTILYAWPTNDVLKTMQVGDSFKLQPISSVNGTGALGVNRLADLEPFIASDGTANLETIASNGAVYAFAAQFAVDATRTPKQSSASTAQQGGRRPSTCAYPRNNRVDRLTVSRPRQPRLSPRCQRRAQVNSCGRTITSLLRWGSTTPNGQRSLT